MYMALILRRVLDMPQQIVGKDWHYIPILQSRNANLLAGVVANPSSITAYCLPDQSAEGEVDQCISVLSSHS